MQKKQPDDKFEKFEISVLLFFAYAFILALTIGAFR
jgi:hypothetical protein